MQDRPSPENGSRSVARALILAGLAGFGIGALTSVGQGSLPHEVAALANSAGSWSAAAFVLALVLGSGRARLGALVGFVALATMLAGYVAATAVRGYSSGTSTILFWTAAALVVGPILGVGAVWVRSGDPRRTAIGIAPLAGILIGEGIYGLRVVADTTYPPYWMTELVLGVALIVVVAIWVRRPALIAVSVGASAIVGLVFYLGYSGDLLALVG